MPIIIVYLNGKINQGMKKIIEEELGFDIEYDVVEVIPKAIKRPNNKITEARGNDVLKNLTIEKINKALKGDMQKLMLENFEKVIKEAIENKNTEIKKEIINLNTKEFVIGFRTVKNDYHYLNYLIDLLGRNLNKFFSEEKSINNIANKSLNLIINSTIIKNIQKDIKYYKEQVRTIIDNIAKEKAEEFIDKQIKKKKKKKKNMNIKNKRSIKDFKNTSKLFLKLNFYYLFQKHILYNVLFFCQKEDGYFEEFEKALNSLLEKLFKTKDIFTIDSKNYLEKKHKTWNIWIFHK